MNAHNKVFTLTQKVFIFFWLIPCLAIGPLAYSQDEEEAMTAESASTADEGAEGKTDESTTPPLEPRKVIDTEKEAIRLLSDEVEEEDLTWLEANGEKFMSLWQADKTGNPFGAVLILHGEGQSVDWPGEVSAIRNNLSHHGWATLSINLPPTAKPQIPERPQEPPAISSEESNGNTENVMSVPDSEPVDQGNDPEAVSEARMQSAIQYLNSQGQYNIVIVSHGIGAIRAGKFIDMLTKTNTSAMAGKIQRPVRALVFVQARNRIGDMLLTRFMNDASLPILDIYYGDHFLDQIEVQQRKKAAATNGIQHYYQVKILRPDGESFKSENRLTRRIRGFLNKHAKGVEVERKKGN